jgi:hypothetical protein
MEFPASMKEMLRRRAPLIFNILTTGKRTLLTKLVKKQAKALPGMIASHFSDNKEAAEIISYLQSHSVEMIPYFYTDEIRNRKIQIHLDKDSGFRYVQLEGNDIFFPKDVSEEVIAEAVKAAIMEQDKRSPHRYLPAGSIEIGGDAAILCGASDGIYALEIVHKFKKIYLFESNGDWIEPLKKTLKKYLDKIEIVPLYVSNINGPTTITLDTFFEKRQHEVNYIQADIEGGELKMLTGAKHLLQKSTSIALCICCYHSKGQEEELRSHLSSNGFKIFNSDGYLLLWMQYPLQSPFLRRGVLYATK